MTELVVDVVLSDNGVWCVRLYSISKDKTVGAVFSLEDFEDRRSAVVRAKYLAKQYDYKFLTNTTTLKKEVVVFT